MHFSQRQAKERNEKENNLQNELNKAKRVFENNPTDLNAYYNDAREKLENFLEVKIKGVIVRTCARWHEHGEKSNKYFLNLEQRNHIKKHKRKLLINDIITTDPLKILKEQECFYNKLYKSNGSDTAWQTSSFLNSLNIPKLSEEQKTLCEGKISSEECLCILENFQNIKTPGNDGIPIEFYRKFWSLISESYVRCANECFEKGEMTHSQKQAVILLIEKKGKDRSLLENWHPNIPC